MKTENLVVQLSSGLRIHVERHLVNPDFETIVLVNGALATTASFGVTLRYVTERYNAICYDLPHAGQSRALNAGHEGLLTVQDEADILVEVIDCFQATLLASVSWGGVSALLALGSGQTRIRRAAICSFSPVVNDAMRDYALGARQLVIANQYGEAAKLLNDTVGKYLPRLIWLQNYRYLARLPKGPFGAQIVFHIDQVLGLDREKYIDVFRHIECPVLFVNGDQDEYTTPADVLELGNYIRQARFSVLPGCGHFIDLEGKEQRELLRGETLQFFAEESFGRETVAREGMAGSTLRAHQTSLLGNIRSLLQADGFVPNQG